MIKTTVAAAALAPFLLVPPVLAAEDAVVADPAHYTVEFENDRLRVIRVKYAPGEKSVMHTHGPNLAVFLSDSTVRMHLPDGTSEDMTTKIGATSWAENEQHRPENVGNGPVEVVLVELKD